MVLIGLLYWSVLDNQLVWDDGYFLDWQQFHSIVDNWQKFFSGASPMSMGLVYRPFRSIYYAASIGLWGKSYVMFHLQSIVIHCLAVLLVYANAKLLLGRHNLALLAALFFGIHPLMTESVTWITASFDTVGSLWFFVSFYGYQRYSISRMSRWYYLSVVTAALAFFSYELTFSLLLILTIYEAMLVKRSAKVTVHIKRLIPFYLILLSYFLIKGYLFSTPPGLEPIFLQMPASILLSGVLVGKYLMLMLFPYPQQINHLVLPGLDNLYYFHIQPIAWNSLLALKWTGLPLLALGVWMLALSYSVAKKHLTVAFLLLWIVLTLIPVVQLIPITSIFAEKYVYLSMFGAANLMALGLGKLQQRSGRNALVLTVIMVLLLAGLTWQRNKVWATPLEFWTAAINPNSENAYVLRQLAATHYMLSNNNKAIELYSRSLEIQPDNMRALINLGYLYAKNLDIVNARKFYQQALLLEPNNQEVLRLIADLPN
jgi:hypothetical protein